MGTAVGNQTHSIHMHMLQATKANFPHAALRNEKKPYATCVALAQGLYSPKPRPLEIYVHLISGESMHRAAISRCLI
jgi:hypothetical protein